jgi:hypothetical protein
MKTLVRALILISACVGVKVFALEPVSAIPNMFYQVPFLSIEDVVLGEGCYSLKAGAHHLDCNPAFLHGNQHREVRANIFIDKRVGDLVDSGEKLSDDDYAGLINKLAPRHEASAARLAGSLWYRHDWWAIGYVPLRLKYASNIQNPAYPQMALSLIRESELFLRAGVGFEDIPGLAAGVNLRYLSQKYIHQQTALFDLISDPSLARTRSREVFSVEPGLTYTFANDTWKPVMSLTVTHPELNPGVEVGFSSTPEFAHGRLVTATHYSVNAPGVHPFKRFRWSGRYDFDNHLALVASVGKGDYGASLSTAIDSLTLGVAYKNEELDYARLHSKSSETYMFEGGLTF